MNTTQSKQPVPTLTIEDIKRAALLVYKKQSKILPKGIRWTTKLMNRLGWHRRYEVIVLDKEQLLRGYPSTYINKYLPHRHHVENGEFKCGCKPTKEA